MRALALWAVAACYAPTAATGVPCGANGACPTGQQCDTARKPPICVDTLAMPDATGGDAPIDTPPGLGPWGAPERLSFTTPNDDDPTLTADELELYFNRDGDIYVTRRASLAGPWDMPVRVAELSSMANESTPELALDGLAIWFASARSGNGEIWSSTRLSRTSAWSPPVLEIILGSLGDDVPGGLRPDGLELAIVSNRGGNYDIYRATRASPLAPWSPPELLAGLTTPAQDESAFFADALTLYFDANPIAVEDFDLFVARRPSPNAPFGAPQRIDELATPTRDHDPWVSPDGRRMYFAAGANGSVLQIYESSR